MTSQSTRISLFGAKICDCASFAHISLAGEFLLSLLFPKRSGVKLSSIRPNNILFCWSDNFFNELSKIWQLYIPEMNVANATGCIQLRTLRLQKSDDDIFGLKLLFSVNGYPLSSFAHGFSTVFRAQNVHMLFEKYLFSTKIPRRIVDFFFFTSVKTVLAGRRLDLSLSLSRFPTLNVFKLADPTFIVHHHLR